MALTLTLYNFSKRQNSTLVPTAQGTSVSVNLKQETSLNNPIFLLSGSKPDANYAQFEGAYYFIDDITSVRANLWEIACTIDVLATFKAQIQATSAFVEYCAQGSTRLTDDRIIPEGITPTAATAAAQLPIVPAGTFLLSAVGEGTSGVRQWCMARGGLSLILESIQEWYDSAIPSAATLEEAFVPYAKNFLSSGDAMSCIRECRWVPFNISALDTGGGTAELTLGQFHTGKNFHWLGNMIYSADYNITIPFTRDGWLRLPPYTDVSVFLPFVGVVNISHPIFSSNNLLNVEFSLNLTSGDIVYVLGCGGVKLGSYGASTAVSIPFGSSNISPMAVLNSIAGAAISASYGNIFGAAGSILSAFQATQTSVGGIQGGAGAGVEDYVIVAVQERAVNAPIGNMAAVQGLPLFATRTLSALSGYVKTRGASVSGNMRGVLRDRINAMLDDGIFLE